MRIDEMIMKANEDGKTYVNQRDEVTYSAANGFNGADIRSLWNEGWEEQPKRHLTVQEAEKELDCVIDADFSKLLRSPEEYPNTFNNVIIFLDHNRDSSYTGFYCGPEEWYAIDKNGKCKRIQPLCWIDPEDILKLLLKQE